jgi:hypothetical protein
MGLLPKDDFSDSIIEAVTVYTPQRSNRFAIPRKKRPIGGLPSAARRDLFRFSSVRWRANDSRACYDPRVRRCLD